MWTILKKYRQLWGKLGIFIWNYECKRLNYQNENYQYLSLIGVCVVM